MGYYLRGDYYRGDYYRGDPQLGAILGKVASSLGVGAVVGKAGRWLLGKVEGGAVKSVAKGLGTAGTAVLAGSLLPKVHIGPITVDPGSMMPGGKPFISYSGGAHRHRRINPLNPKALRRALRRAEGFEKFAKRTVNALYSTHGGRRVHTFKRSHKRAS